MTLYLTLSVLASVFVPAVHGGGGLDSFWTKFNGLKFMDSCLTPEGTGSWVQQAQKALTDCNAKYKGRSVSVRSVEEADWDAILDRISSAPSRKRRSVILSAEKIQKIKEKLSKKIEIYRCVMQEVRVNDANNSVSTTNFMGVYRSYNISSKLLADAEQMVMQCHAFSECLPLADDKDLIIPADVIRTRAFLECEYCLRYWFCLKDDVKSKVAKGAFDFAGLDGSFSYLKSDEDRAVAILMAEELVGPDDFNLYE